MMLFQLYLWSINFKITYLANVKKEENIFTLNELKN